MPGNDLLHRFDRERGLYLGIEIDGEPDDEIIAGKLAYAPEYFGGEAHPVFEPAAPFVVAAIGEWRPELIDNGVIGSENFDAVEP